MWFAISWWWVLIGVPVAALVLFVLYLLKHAIAQRDAPFMSGMAAATFRDPTLGQHVSFGSLTAPASVFLSVIVPAYNEEYRMGQMLDECLKYLHQRALRDRSFSYEVIIVDDGSRDRTTEVGMMYTKQYGSDIVRVLTLRHNVGKGGAVQRGMFVSRGQYILFADADGATRFSDVEPLLQEMQQIEQANLGIVVGSRAHLQTEAVSKRKWYRNLLMYGFHLYVTVMGVRKIKDTQCGFKLFTRKAAQLLFPNQHLQRWAFDVELLYMAQNYFKIPVSETAVNWVEIAGSKLNVYWASLQMARDLLVIKLGFVLGLWHARAPAWT